MTSRKPWNKERAVDQRALQDFQALLSLRNVPEADRAVLRGMVDNAPLDFANLRGSFDTVVDSALAPDSGLTDAGRIAIREAYRPQTMTTGTDVGRETDRTITDPDTGEKKPLYTDKAPLKIRDNVDAYVNDQGVRRGAIEHHIGSAGHRKAPGFSLQLRPDLAHFRVLRQQIEGPVGFCQQVIGGARRVVPHIAPDPVDIAIGGRCEKISRHHALA